MKFIGSIAFAWLCSCGGTDVDSCKVACTEDSECPDGQTCSDVGRCTAGELCSEGTCIPGAFLGCIDELSARVCDETGTATTSDGCGGFGCDLAGDRCNECEPARVACAGDAVTTCTEDGLIAAAEACAIGCVDDVEPARCLRISPIWIPDACDAAATAPTLTVATATTIDTDLDDSCTGGVIAQAPGPEICVVHYGTISLEATVTVMGQRAVAFVADGPLEVSGVLDISARGSVSGPGGGFTTSGANPSNVNGAGGAGFKQTGGRGGGRDAAGTGAGAGGSIRDPLVSASFEGGSLAPGSGAPGGGGGAVLLVSCTATVAVPGTVRAGGGGGSGGFDGFVTVAGTFFLGGGGGGSGGYIVLQGAQVEVTGELLSNGGGGGGSCGTDNCTGLPGKDGVDGGQGGSAASGGTAGGAGGKGTTNPGNGTNSATNPAGGGGGSTGRHQVYTPSGVIPLLAPALAEPAFEPSLTVPAR